MNERAEQTGQSTPSLRVGPSDTSRATRMRRGEWLANRAASFAGLALIGALGLAACSDEGNSGTTGGAGTGGATGSAGAGGGGGAGGMGGGGDTDSSTRCALRTDIDTYSANMTKKGEKGALSFVLVESNPAPPGRTENVWKVKITGADGMPITTGLAVDVRMPEHGHNSTIPPKFTYDAASGTFIIDPVYLHMTGKWRIRLDIVSADSTLVDGAEFFFCLD